MSTGNPQNLLNYVDTDFGDLINQLIARLQSDPAWIDTYRSSGGEMMIELFCYVGNLILYYIERRAEESYIETAQLRSSIINLVRLLNYTPSRGVSATGQLTFTLEAPLGVNVYIPKYTVAESSDGYQYLTSEDAVILAGQTSVVVNAIEGTLINLTFTSDGTANQVYNINDTEVENTNIFIYDDNVIENIVTSFLDSTNTSNDCKLRTEIDDTISVLFGDGVNGAIPPNGDIISITYIRTDGLSGNVFNLNQITNLVSSIFDANGNLVQGMTVTNSTLFLGGADEESTESIRQNAPAVFSTGDRAVTKYDYIAILENYPGIVEATAWGEAENNPPSYDQFNNVNLVIILQNWNLPDEFFESNLAGYLYDYAQLTVKYTFLPAVVLYALPVLSVAVLPGYTLTAMQAAIQAAIQALFVLGTTAVLGQAVRLANVYAAVQAVPGVAYCIIYLQIFKQLIAHYDSVYDFGFTLEAPPILPKSVQVLVNNIPVAIDNGSGGFTTTASGYTVTGSVNYTTGYIGVNISPTLGSGSVVAIQYQQSPAGDITVLKNQICNLQSVNITSINYAAT